MTGSLKCNMDRVLLEEYVEGLSDPLERILVEEHIKGCACCRREITELKLLSWELKQLADQRVEYPEALDDLCEDLINSVCQRPYGLRYRLKAASRVPGKVLSSMFGITRGLPLRRQARKLSHILAGRAERSDRKKKSLTGLAMSMLKRSKRFSRGLLQRMIGGMG